MRSLRELLTADAFYDNVFSINFEEEIKRGIRGVIFDIDNTLVPHGRPSDEKVRVLFASLKEKGLRVCLISNNDDQRVRPFAVDVEAYYVCKAGKPKKSGMKKALAEMEVRESEALFVGDQLFTDILGARRCHIRCFQVRPVDESTDPPFVAFKRKLEKLIMPSQKIKKEKG